MKQPKLILPLALVAGSLTLALQTLVAQPSGSITNAVTNAANALWDFSQLTNELQTISVNNQNFVLDYADPFTQDGHGKFVASASTTAATVLTGISNDNTPATNDLAEAPYKVTGSVTSAKGVAKIAFTTKLSGTVESDGKSREFSFSEAYMVKVDAVGGQVTGRWTVGARLAGGGAPTRSKTTSGTYGPYPLTDYLAEVGNGTWTLVLDFNAASGNTLGGNATVTLDSGTVYPFTFTGAYSAHSGESKLNLKGQGAAAGSLLQVTLNSSNQVTRIAGHVSGQTVNFSP